MSGYYVAPPKSRKELRLFAKKLRAALGLESAVYFPVVKLLDVLSCLLDDFNYEIVKDDDLPPDIHAETDITNNVIRIKESIYRSAVDGLGRDRMTIAHEICHYFLIKKNGVVLHDKKGAIPVPTYCDPEWQARCMAGELLIDKDLVQEFSVFDIELRCGVSYDAAIYQYKKNH